MLNEVSFSTVIFIALKFTIPILYADKYLVVKEPRVKSVILIPNSKLSYSVNVKVSAIISVALIF